MYQQKELDKFFQERQHLPAEMPSPAVWQRLEHRLDVAATRSLRARWIRRMAVAAGISATIAFSWLIGTRLGRGTSGTGFRLEVVGNTVDYPQALMAIALQKDLTIQSVGIREGEPGKKFR